MDLRIPKFTDEQILRYFTPIGHDRDPRTIAPHTPGKPIGSRRWQLASIIVLLRERNRKYSNAAWDLDRYRYEHGIGKKANPGKGAHTSSTCEIGVSYGERYQPAMRLAGATRAHARGVTDSRIGSDGWFGDPFMVCVL
jgi:hypothetical protein